MPPIDLNRKPTPWWVLDTKRIASIVEAGKYETLVERDKEIFKEAVQRLYNQVTGETNE